MKEERREEPRVYVSFLLRSVRTRIRTERTRGKVLSLVVCNKLLCMRAETLNIRGRKSHRGTRTHRTCSTYVEYYLRENVALSYVE